MSFRWRTRRRYWTYCPTRTALCRGSSNGRSFSDGEVRGGFKAGNRQGRFPVGRAPRGEERVHRVVGQRVGVLRGFLPSAYLADARLGRQVRRGGRGLVLRQQAAAQHKHQAQGGRHSGQDVVSRGGVRARGQQRQIQEAGQALLVPEGVRRV